LRFIRRASIGSIRRLDTTGQFTEGGIAMELTDALRIPLAPSAVWNALRDIALMRASLENCESFARLPSGETALTLTVPLGPLRARYEVRAHVASQDGQASDLSNTLRRTLNFKARAVGVGSLRGQIDVALSPDGRGAGFTGAGQPGAGQPGAGQDGAGRTGSGDPEDGAAQVTEAQATRIDYAVWATLTGPLAELPPRQIENALHELADDFFAEFCAVVEAKHGKRPNRARVGHSRRQHVFLRPINLAGLGRRPSGHDPLGALAGRAASMLVNSRAAHRAPSPQVMPAWAWAVVIVVVAALLYALRWLG
jgi:carbon monoxide dehydrogenase subunit G